MNKRWWLLLQSPMLGTKSCNCLFSLPDYGYRWASSPELHKSISGNIQGELTEKSPCSFIYKFFTIPPNYKHLLLRCNTSTWHLCTWHNEEWIALDSYCLPYSSFISYACSTFRSASYKQSHAFNMHAYLLPADCLSQRQYVSTSCPLFFFFKWEIYCTDQHKNIHDSYKIVP
jgi:hypothetical protein